jgi:hypothetical protein
MKRSFAFFAALAALVLGATIVFHPAGSDALAQTGQTQAIAADEVIFSGRDSVDFRPGVGFGVNRLVTIVQQAQQAQTPGSRCPIEVDLKVYAASSGAAGSTRPDPLFSQALAAARRDAITGVLQGFGPSVRINADAAAGLVNMVFISAQTAKDKEPPKLHTISVPPKGSKVQPGQQIAVTMTARDDANNWQSGIKTVTLVADSEGDRLVAGPTYVRGPGGCTEAPREREVRATYTVPANPPAVVRLTATAMDHVNLTDKDVGEFPTGDFYGAFKATTFTVGRDTHRAQAEIVLNHDGRGTLTGTMTGQQEYVSHSTGNCSFRTVQPNRFRVSLVGSITDRSSPAEGPTLKVFIGEVEETALTAEARCDGGGGGPVGPPGGWKFKTSVYPPEAFLGTPSALGEGQVLPDGTREYKFESAAGGAGTRWAVTLRRARN